MTTIAPGPPETPDQPARTQTTPPRRRLPDPGPGWWRAPIQALRTPAMALSIAAAVALLSFATVSRPLFTVAAGNDALERELAQFQAEALGTVLQVIDSVDADAWRQVDDELRGWAAGRGLSPPAAELGPIHITALDADGEPAAVAYPIGFPVSRYGLYARAGGIDLLPEAEGGGQGVWLPRRLAAVLAVEPGDDVVLAHEAQQRSVRVAGTYRDLIEAIPTGNYTGPDALPADDEIARFWAARGQHISDVNPSGDPLPAPPLIVAEPETAVALADELGTGTTRMLWRFPFHEPRPTVAQAEEVQGRFDALEADALDVTSPLGSAVSTLTARRAGGIATTSLLEGAIERPAALVATLDASLAPLTLGSQALALLALVGVLVLSARRRRREASMLVVQGASSVWVATRAIWETALPAAAGALVGVAAAVALAHRIGPLGGPPGQFGQTVAGATITAWLIAMTMAGLVAWLLRTSGAGRGGGVVRQVIRRLPWELLLVAGTAASGLTLAGRDGGLLVAGDGGVLQVDVLAVAFPLLLVATVAALAGRLAGYGFAALTPLGGRAGLAWYLAVRRLATGGRETRVVVAALVLGTGLTAFGLTAAASTSATIEAKASAVAGAQLAMRIPPREVVPPDLPTATTEVLRTGGAVEPGGREVEILAIDPATFPHAAAWVSGFSDQPLSTLLEGLADGDDGTVPLLAVGVPAASAQQLVTSRYAVDVRVIAELQAFPGMRGDRAVVAAVDTLVAATRVVEPQLDEMMWLRRQRELWLASDVLEPGDISPTHLQQHVRRLSEVAERPDLVAAATTLSYLRGIGLVAGVLSLALLLAYAVAKERTRAAALALAERMGARSTALRLTVVAELGALLSVGIAAGGVSGLLAARLMTTMTDPVPALPPAPLLTVPLGAFAAAGAVLVAAVICAAVLADRARRSVKVSEVLREG